MKVIGSSSLIALLFAATFVAPATAGEAMSPSYVSSEPSDGEMMEKAPERVEVTFDEPLDPSSQLKVTDECGRRVDGGGTDVELNKMSVRLARKPVGTYKVTYFARGVGGVTGQETGIFDFMVHSGPSCGPKSDGGGHADHGDNDGGGNGSGGHDGGHDGGGNGSGAHDAGHDGSGQQSGGEHGSMTDHSSMGHGGRSGSDNHSGRHGSRKHSGGKHGKGKQGQGKHGAHGLLDILEENEREEQGALAAGSDGAPAPDGQAVLWALTLSLLMGVIGGWFLRVSGAR